MATLLGGNRSANYARFIERFPGYAGTAALDGLRATEFERLDRLGHVYLDYTGGGLYGRSQVVRHMDLLLAEVFGNPHSSNPTSAVATEAVEATRRHVLRFFNASPDEYGVVFTGNASHALKLVGESYPFEAGDSFLLTFDNHNSVNGIREFDRARGARTTYIPVRPPAMRVDEPAIGRYLESAPGARHKLFAYPAQSNFSGARHPLEWIAMAQAAGWDVLLDAAAFVPTNRLDLSSWKPDYVALSFYKMFGYPTGVGALIARLPALEKLRRPWFAGGTITVASVQADKHYLAAGSAAFEDGTANYECIPAVDIGLSFVESIGMDLIHERVAILTGYLLEEMLALHHSNGQPVVALYGPPENERRGGTLTFNVHAASGEIIDHRTIEQRANERRISLRTGCFCNPGAGEMALGLGREELVGCFTDSAPRMSFDDFRRCVDKKSTGAVRISLGAASNFADANAFLRFLGEFVT
jgi:selenocysteine lyase/cysteine desulfurase